MNYANLLAVAFAEAQTGFDEDGVPIFDSDDVLLGAWAQSPQIWFEDIGECVCV